MSRFDLWSGAWALLQCLGLFACTQTTHALDDAKLVDLAGTASAHQSSTLGTFAAALAVDGDPATFSHTAGDETTAFLEIELNSSRVIRAVSLHSRQDCCKFRSRDLNVVVLDRPGGQEVFNYRKATGTLLNPGNELCGPDQLELDLWQLSDTLVQGGSVRVERYPADPGQIPPVCPGMEADTDARENPVLSLSEVSVWGVSP